jgi:hypothetical protein
MYQKEEINGDTQQGTAHSLSHSLEQEQQSLLTSRCFVVSQNGFFLVAVEEVMDLPPRKISNFTEWNIERFKYNRHFKSIFQMLSSPRYS